eukprot:jgi/Chlat1/2777/Chrsp187S02911
MLEAAEAKARAAALGFETDGIDNGIDGVDDDDGDRGEGYTGIEKLLLAMLPDAQALARPPISNFRVGAVGLGDSGRLYVGVNLEFPGLPLSNSVHAEQFLVQNALIHGEEGLRVVAVSHAPCGHCRQFVGELSSSQHLRFLVYNKSPSTLPLLLPHRFGPLDLLHESEGKRTSLLLEKRENGMRVEGGETHVQVSPSSPPPLTLFSLTGMVLQSRGGLFSAGSYIECAAFNPSLPPLQATLISFVTSGGGDYANIDRAVLVERSDAPVRHADSTRLAMRTICPHAELRVVGAVVE